MRGPGGVREVAALAWPLALGMVSFTVMGVTDTLLMGRVSTAAQAGVGLAVVLTFTVLAFYRGLASGAQSIISAADGADDRRRVARGGGAALLVGAAGGLLAGLSLALVWRAMAPWASDDAEVLHHADAFIGCRAWLLPVDGVAVGLMTALQGRGDTRARMWASMAGNLVNVVGDLLFIFGWGPVPAMGAAGAALATGLGSATMAVVYAARFHRLFGRPTRPTWEVLRSTLTIGLPAGVQFSLGTLSFTAMNLALAQVGAAHLAASQIVVNVVSISFLPGFGLGEAAGILVGRYLGARRPRTADRAMRSARRVSVWVMGGFSVLFAFFGDTLALAFTKDPEVIALAEPLFLLAAGFQMMDAVVMTHLSALRGAGDTRYTLVVTTACAWGLTVPAAIVLGIWLQWGAVGAWLGLLVEIAVLALLTTRRVGGLRAGRVGRLEVLLGEA